MIESMGKTLSSDEVKLLLSQLVQQGELGSLDRHFALEMARLHQDDSPLMLIICALVSRQLSAQHPCLDLDSLVLANPFGSSRGRCRISLERDALLAAIAALDAVGMPEPALTDEQASAASAPQSAHQISSAPNKPLILDGKRLYLRRYYGFETAVARRLSALAAEDIAGADIAGAGIADTDSADTDSAVAGTINTVALLDELFPAGNGDIDWQKIAVALASGKRLAVITGGPGTGKTTTVTKLLLLLMKQTPLKIRMVAPTGKAAARLSESIKASKQRLKATLETGLIPPADVDALPEEASTLHRLLGVIPGSNRFRHHKDNPLELDLLLVDEASMVDLPMMHRLLDALPKDCRLILLGDQDQLASVEAGAVLADICEGARQGYRYSAKQCQRLYALTGTVLQSTEAAGLGDNLCTLTHSHRFRADAGIGQLALAVNAGDKARVGEVWRHGYSELTWLSHGAANAGQGDTQSNTQSGKGEGLNALISLACDAYGDYLQAMASFAPPEDILERYNRFRVLCATRSGEYGVEGINLAIIAALSRRGLIQPKQEFFAGRPIIIQSNDYGLGLFNGDIGIVLPRSAEDPRLMAHFIQSDGSMLKILPARLPSHDTCFAMTVHKSQGSEFSRVALSLPVNPSPAQQSLLGRELIYTAITRAKDKFICLGNEALFEAAIDRRTERASGLAKRLWQGN
ncbi:exodeoxyribonuclease V subunit alpha [Shewanella sp. JM162201]|uniref:RecBCD enzyme subunit RecD n=1 Tax=Shewanella jiangmenensis TaxID=2837387 RepID=A0ABS5V509_9GAMM|nr:exodeoxyribonuclease V subunit alpha [Shewanella jiangmenensis]MBT1445552.1 exodeoxyribonuclease V subunit alpha [Shewanella jiangmenensis]